MPERHEIFCEVDAAVIYPDRNIEIARETTLGPIRRTLLDISSESPTTVIEVWKRGAATGLTGGTLEAKVIAQSLFNARTSRWATHPEGHHIIGREGQPFAADGDSGAAVIDGANNVVGMVVGLQLDIQEDSPYGPLLGAVTDDTLAYCIPIARILEALRVRL